LTPSQPQQGADYAAAAFCPDSQCVLVACPDHTARIWNVNDGREMFILRGHTGRINDAVFSADGRQLLTAADDLTPRIWDPHKGTELHILKGHDAGPKERQRGVWGGAFSPDGKLVVTCGKEGVAHLWNAATAEELVEWKGLEPARLLYGYRFSAAFSTDGLSVLTVRADGSARLWPTDPLSVAIKRKPRDFTPAERARFAAELRVQD
jgi:WD40 repeat protein